MLHSLATAARTTFLSLHETHWSPSSTAFSWKCSQCCLSILNWQFERSIFDSHKHNKMTAAAVAVRKKFNFFLFFTHECKCVCVCTKEINTNPTRHYRYNLQYLSTLLSFSPSLPQFTWHIYVEREILELLRVMVCCCFMRRRTSRSDNLRYLGVSET